MAKCSRDEMRRLLIRKISIMEQLSALRNKRETLNKGDPVSIEIVKCEVALSDINKKLAC